jgi:Na+-driven multidrug efflux pump
MVAGLGDIKMSGVNITNQIMFVYFVALNTVAAGGGIFMSQFNGAKDAEGMRQTFRYKIHTSLILTAVILALCVFLPEKLLGFLVNTNTQSGPIVEEGKKYLAIIVFTLIPSSLSVVIGSSLREIGRVKAPLVISVLATFVNTFFNWMLIYGNLGAPRLEVRGAALATVIARVFEMVVFIAFIRIKKPAFYSRFRDLWKIKLSLFFGILRKSGIIFISEMSWAVTETIMTAVYNGRGGAEIVSGMAAGWAIANLFFLVFGGIHTSVGVIVGGTLGRNDLERAQDEARWLMNGSFLLGISVAVLEAFSVFLIPVVFGNLSGHPSHALDYCSVHAGVDLSERPVRHGTIGRGCDYGSLG